MKLIWISSLLALSFISRAGQAPSEFESALGENIQIRTQESVIEVAGTRYRKIDSRKTSYFIKFPSDMSSVQSLHVLCQRENASVFRTTISVVSGAQVVSRPSGFIAGLEKSCAQNGKLVRVPASSLGYSSAVPDLKSDAPSAQQGTDNTAWGNLIGALFGVVRY